MPKAPNRVIFCIFVYRQVLLSSLTVAGGHLKVFDTFHVPFVGALQVQATMADLFCKR